MGKLNLHCWCTDIHLNKVEKKLFKSAKNYTVLHCSYFNFVQIRLNNSASSIAQVQISHPFLLLLTPLPSLGAEWIVEWKEFSSKVPVCRATLPTLPRLAAPRCGPPRSSSADILWMTWRVKLCLNSSQVRNLSFDQESFHKICLRAAPRHLRATLSRQLKSSFPLLTQKEFGEGDNFPKRVGSSHGG